MAEGESNCALSSDPLLACTTRCYLRSRGQGSCEPPAPPTLTVTAADIQDGLVLESQHNRIGPTRASALAQYHQWQSNLHLVRRVQEMQAAHGLDLDALAIKYKGLADEALIAAAYTE